MLSPIASGRTYIPPPPRYLRLLAISASSLFFKFINLYLLPPPTSISNSRCLTLPRLPWLCFLLSYASARSCTISLDVRHVETCREALAATLNCEIGQTFNLTSLRQARDWRFISCYTIKNPYSRVRACCSKRVFLKNPT